MILLISLILAVSLIFNGILIWYTRKLVQKLSYGVDNIDQLQKLLDEYCALLEGMLQLDQYYGDDTIVGAVKNTKLVVETCKMYKKTIMEQQEENMSEYDESPQTTA